MIIWLTGNSGSGKTTLASRIKDKFPNFIILDGDDIRNSVSQDLGLSKDDRIKNNVRIAKLANILHKQGFSIVISSIAPYQQGRDLASKIIDCKWVYLSGGKSGDNYPYEIPNCKEFKTMEDLDDFIAELEEE